VENTEEKKNTYTLFWSGEEISADYLSTYYANELDEIKDKNLLLGEFKSNGKYVFNAEMKKALVAIKKRVEDKNENSYFLIAKTFKNSFNFKMRVFEVEDNNLLAANLYLIEVVDDERFKKPIKTFVAQYVDKKNDEFINKAKYIFNIVVDGEFNEFEKRENETIIEPILPKLVEKNEALLEIAAENFIEAMIEELEKTEEGKKILKEFEEATKYLENKGKSKKEALEKGEEIAPKPNFKQLKKKLDSIVEGNKGYEVIIQTNPEIKKAIEKYNEAVEQEKKASAQTELMPEDYKKIKEEIDKEKNKTAPTPVKKAQSTKSNSGKSAGGGGDSANKKTKKGRDGGDGNKKKDNKKKEEPKKHIWDGFVMPSYFDVPILKINVDEKIKTKKNTPPPKIQTTEKKPVLKGTETVAPPIQVVNPIVNPFLNPSIRVSAELIKDSTMINSLQQAGGSEITKEEHIKYDYTESLIKTTQKEQIKI